MSHTLMDPLACFAAKQPHAVAAVTPNGERINACQLDRAAAAAAATLGRMGAKPGTVVGLDGAPGLAWLAALAGCWRLGAIAAPLNHRGTEPEREQAARTMGCQFLWVPDNTLLDAGSGGEPFEPGVWSYERPLLRVCTSGSTGKPRSVELTAGQLHSGAVASLLRLGHVPSDRWLVCLPVNHVGALATIFRCLHNQICLELHTGFDRSLVSARLDGGRVSLISLVPAMLEDILDLRGERSFPKFLRVILLGGAACSQSLLERCRIARLPLALTWGMTETASQAATREPGDLSALEDGLPPLPGVQVSVDEQGRLVVQGAIAAGRVLSADFGEITPGGRVRIIGRSDQVIIRGGENIQPGEIENVLRRHPDVGEAVVLARADARLGQVPVAFIQGRNVDPLTLADWCRQHLAGFKVPVEFITLARLPRSAAGKVDRQRLLAELGEASGASPLAHPPDEIC